MGLPEHVYLGHQECVRYHWHHLLPAGGSCRYEEQDVLIVCIPDWRAPSVPTVATQFFLSS